MTLARPVCAATACKSSRTNPPPRNPGGNASPPATTSQVHPAAVSPGGSQRRDGLPAGAPNPPRLRTRRTSIRIDRDPSPPRRGGIGGRADQGPRDRSGRGPADGGAGQLAAPISHAPGTMVLWPPAWAGMGRRVRPCTSELSPAAWSPGAGVRADASRTARGTATWASSRLGSSTVTVVVCHRHLARAAYERHRDCSASSATAIAAPTRQSTREPLGVTGNSTS
jgi:hypothetical protein